jgi:hypothetical protein
MTTLFILDSRLINERDERLASFQNENATMIDRSRGEDITPYLPIKDTLVYITLDKNNLTEYINNNNKGIAYKADSIEQCIKSLTLYDAYRGE